MSVPDAGGRALGPDAAGILLMVRDARADHAKAAGSPWRHKQNRAGRSDALWAGYYQAQGGEDVTACPFEVAPEAALCAAWRCGWRAYRLGVKGAPGARKRAEKRALNA